MEKMNLKFKRVIRRYEYLIEELEDAHDMYSDATREFNMALAKTQDKEYYAPKVDDENTEDVTVKIEMAKEYKKLFRKIVVKCHPDKIDKELSDLEKAKLRDYYETAVTATELGEPTPLIAVAVKLDIDVSAFEKDIGEISTTCEKIEEGIKQFQGTSAWYYTYMLTTDEEKEDFIKKFINVTKK